MISFRHPHFSPECDFVGVAECNGELDGFGEDYNYEQWYGFTNPKHPSDTLFFSDVDIVAEAKV